MESNKATITTRGWFVIWTLVLLATIAFTKATADVCYVGNLPGNHFGYGSCEQMLDTVIKGGK